MPLGPDDLLFHTEDGCQVRSQLKAGVKQRGFYTTDRDTQEGRGFDTANLLDVRQSEHLSAAGRELLQCLLKNAAWLPASGCFKGHLVAIDQLQQRHRAFFRISILSNRYSRMAL